MHTILLRFSPELSLPAPTKAISTHMQLLLNTALYSYPYITSVGSFRAGKIRTPNTGKGDN